MKKKNIFIALFMLSSVMISSITMKEVQKRSETQVAHAETATYSLADDPIHNNSTIQSYYNSISDSVTGSDLLEDLHSLNSKKRTKTVGYGSLGKYYKQTDGDPNNSNNIISFYSGESVAFSGSFGGNVNREHVWPNSRGGGSVDGDIHMTRPTLKSENGSRGNSFYVEGKKTSNSGWDPAMESFGKEKYRGISARIIFYCAIADTSLTLVDSTNDSSANKTMGKLSDLLKWNLKYEIDSTETRRNDAAQKIQGNRNPFIDDRSLACKIWGNTNASTRAVCAGQIEDAPVPTSIEIKAAKTSLEEGETLQLNWNVLPAEANQKVTWESSDLNVATISTTGLITALKEGTTTITATSLEKSSITASITLTVQKKEIFEITSITISGAPNKTAYQPGDVFDATGLEIKGTLKDGSQVTISPQDLDWFNQETKSNILSEGVTSVLGIYNGKVSCVYSGITVGNSLTNEVIKVELLGNLSKKYKDGDMFNGNGLKLKIYNNDGFDYDVSAKNIEWNIATITKEDKYILGYYKNYIVYLEIQIEDDVISSESCSKSSMNFLLSFSLIGILLSLFIKKKFE